MTKYPDEVEQHGFSEKAMAMILVAMVVSKASLYYMIMILFDLFKAYDLVQKDQVMAIVDEDRSVATAGMVVSLLHSSTLTTMATSLLSDNSCQRWSEARRSSVTGAV